MRRWIFGAFVFLFGTGFLMLGTVRWQAGCRYDAVRAELHFLRVSIGHYQYDTHRWPHDLKDLLHDDGTEGWSGPYAKPTDLNDAWGDPIEYRLQGAAPPVLASRGRGRERLEIRVHELAGTE